MVHKETPQNNSIKKQEPMGLYTLSMAKKRKRVQEPRRKSKVVSTLSRLR